MGEGVGHVAKEPGVVHAEAPQHGAHFVARRHVAPGPQLEHLGCADGVGQRAERRQRQPPQVSVDHRRIQAVAGARRVERIDRIAAGQDHLVLTDEEAAGHTALDHDQLGAEGQDRLG